MGLSLQPFLVLPLILWRQSVNESSLSLNRQLVWLNTSSHKTSAFTKPWAHVPTETLEHRDLVVVAELALSASLPLHCAIWCMAQIVAHCQAFFSLTCAEKHPFETQYLPYKPSANVFYVRPGSISYCAVRWNKRSNRPSEYEWSQVSTIKSAVL